MLYRTSIIDIVLKDKRFITNTKLTKKRKKTMSNVDLAEMAFESKRITAEKEGGQGLFDNFVPMPKGNGHITLRLMPPMPGCKVPFQATRIHKVNGKSVHCLRELDRKTGRWMGDCPICTHYSHLWKESEKPGITKEEAKDLQDQARALKPYERYYYNAMIRSLFNDKTQAVEKNVGPRIFSAGKDIHSKIVRAFVGDKELDEKELGDITDVKGIEGRDLKVVVEMRQGDKSAYANYSGSKFLDPSPLGTPTEVAKWLGEMHDLSQLRVLKSKEELKHLLRCHFGVETDTGATDYDPSEYMKPEAKAAAKAAVETPSAKAAAKAVVVDTPPVTAKAKVDSDGDEAVLEEDFMAQLQNMAQ